MHIQKQNIFAFLLAFIFGLCLCASAFAVETEDPAASSAASSEVVEEIVEETPVQEVTPVAETDPVAEETPVEDTPQDPVEDPVSDSTETEEEDTGNDEILADAELVGIEVYSLSPITPEDTTGLKSVLLEFIGDYDPVIVEYEYQNGNNSYSSYLREVQPDYVWLCSCGLLVVMLVSLFKLGGAVLCRR